MRRYCVTALLIFHKTFIQEDNGASTHWNFISYSLQRWLLRCVPGSGLAADDRPFLNYIYIVLFDLGRKELYFYLSQNEFKMYFSISSIKYIILREKVK